MESSALVDVTTLPQGTIGVAVSGGVDSMCLLHALHALDVPVLALTVEHGIRAQESLRDLELVQDYCAQLGVPLEVRRVDVPAYAEQHKMGLEQAARVVRYAFFDEVRQKGEVCCVATAHHADDLCESVWLNLLRGSGVRGLVGIHPREGYIRPLLGVDKATLEAYAAEHHVPHATDSTNADTRYTRNFVRQEVLPLVEQRFPHYRKSTLRLAEAMREQVELMDALAIHPTWQGGAAHLPLAPLRLQHPALAKWSIQLAVRHFDSAIDVEAVHWQQALALLHAPHATTLHLPHDIRVAVEYDDLVFWRHSTPDRVEYPFGLGTFAFGKARFTVRTYQEGDRLRFDADAIPEGAVLRLRQDGDTIAKFGGGTKSLGDYYTDCKVPVRLRDTMPVVAVGHRVLVCCADISRDVAERADTQHLYTLLEEE